MKNDLINEPVIEIKGLEKSFANQIVLKDINLELNARENLVVLGKSGSGKSVLIKCIVKLLEIDKGIINVLGKNISQLNSDSLAEARQNIGFLFQSGALYDSMSVEENLRFPLVRIRKNISEKEIQLKIAEVLSHVKLEDALKKMPSQLSGGMRKRISLARTIIVDPVIMLYDEPTTGLDPVTSDEISTLILEVQKVYNTASIIITHDINCAIKTANRMVMLQEQTIYKTGTGEDFLNSDDPIIAAFFQDLSFQNKQHGTI